MAKVAEKIPEIPSARNRLGQLEWLRDRRRELFDKVLEGSLKLREALQKAKANSK